MIGTGNTNMNQAPEITILVAISFTETSDDFRRKLVVLILEKKGYSTISAQSPEHAIDLINSEKIDAIVMTSDWAVVQSKSHATSLIEIAKETIPTLTLILPNDFYSRIYDKVYFSRKNEYVRVPINSCRILDPLETVLKTFGKSARK